MIWEDEVWINIFPSRAPGPPSRIAGKWLCFGPTLEMHLYRDLLDTLVEEGEFPAVKIARKHPEHDPFPHKDCVVCVFTTAHEADIQRTWHRLRNIGLQPTSWKSEAKTEEDWRPAGRLALERRVVEERRHLADRAFDVFISKNSEDLGPARTVHDFLTSNGLKVFLSESSLPTLGQADYQEAIERALEAAVHLVVVASTRQNLDSPWVKAEIHMFLGEVRSGKKSGNVVTMLTGALEVGDLPLALRSYQALRLDERGLGNLLGYVRTSR